MKRYRYIGSWEESYEYGFPQPIIGQVYNEDEVISDENAYFYSLQVPHEWEEVKDNINPDHYKQGKAEVIDMIESATVGISGFEGFCVGNIIKYVSRYNNKNGIEDVRKASWYIDRLLKHLEDVSTGV